MATKEFTLVFNYASSSECEEDDGISSLKGYNCSDNTSGASPAYSSNKSSMKGLRDESPFKSLALGSGFPTRSNTISKNRCESRLDTCCQII